MPSMDAAARFKAAMDAAQGGRGDLCKQAIP